MKQILVLLLTLFFFTGCKKSLLMQYQGGNNIYFSYTYGTKSIATYGERIIIPFGKNLASTGYDVVFDVKALGNLENRKRPFQLMVDKTNSTAIEGVHFELPPIDSFYIGPNKAAQKLTVKILRPVVLRDTSAFLEIKLLANNEFQTGLSIPSYANEQSLATTIRISIDDRLPKPIIWDSSMNVLGLWSREKLEKMVLVLPASIDLFYTDNFPYTPGELTTLSKNMQKYLNTQKNLGKTVYEKNGSEMTMGPSAQ